MKYIYIYILFPYHINHSQWNFPLHHFMNDIDITQDDLWMCQKPSYIVCERGPGAWKAPDHHVHLFAALTLDMLNLFRNKTI